MKTMILAAGLGTRLRPLTDTIAKPMIPVVNKPVMEHVIELLARQGFRDLYANIHYKADEIVDYFGNGKRWNVDLKYSHEDVLAGTAGGLKKLESFFRDDTFVVFSSDLLTDIDLGPIIAFHKERQALATIALIRVEDPSDYGVVRMDERGCITAFQEKPSRDGAVSNLASCGIYVFEPEVMEHIPPECFYDFGADLFPSLFATGAPLYGYKHDDYWLDIGKIPNYWRGNFDALSGQVQLTVQGNQIDDRVWIGDRTVIADTAILQAPLYIGKNCLVGNEARLIGPAIIGDNNIIDAGETFTGKIRWPNGHINRKGNYGGPTINVIDEAPYYLFSTGQANPGLYTSDGLSIKGGRRMDSLKRKYKKDPKIVSRTLDTETILIPIRGEVSDLNSVYTLNEVGARVWELIDGMSTIDDIVKTIVSEFEVDRQHAQKDITLLTSELESIGSIS